MMRAFGWFVLCVCLLAGAGYYLGWFNVSGSVNKDKVKEDMEVIKDKIQGRAGGPAPMICAGMKDNAAWTVAVFKNS